MKAPKKSILAAAVAALGVTGFVAAGPASAATTVQGCPSGYMCVYPQNTGWNGGHPSLMFYTYGVHNLSGQYGMHRVLNNQTGRATGYACTGYNGTGEDLWGIDPTGWVDRDLTPINSIVLNGDGAVPAPYC